MLLMLSYPGFGPEIFSQDLLPRPVHVCLLGFVSLFWYKMINLFSHTRFETSVPCRNQVNLMFHLSFQFHRSDYSSRLVTLLVLTFFQISYVSSAKIFVSFIHNSKKFRTYFFIHIYILHFTFKILHFIFRISIHISSLHWKIFRVIFKNFHILIHSSITSFFHSS